MSNDVLEAVVDDPLQGTISTISSI